MALPFATLFQFGAARGAGLGVQVAFRAGVKLERAAWSHGAVDLVLVGDGFALRSREAVTEGLP